MADPRFVVVGTGAMGSLVAARLALASVAVTMLGRASAHLAVIRGGWLWLEELDGSVHSVPLDATDQPETVIDSDVVLLLVTSWATGEAMAPLRSLLRPDAMVVTLHNGLGNSAAIRAAGGGPPADIVLGVTSQVALRIAPGGVRHTGLGPTLIGRESGVVDAPLAAVATILTGAGLPTAASADIERAVWRKLAVNAAISGVTALAGVPNGAVVDYPGLALDDVVAAVEEVATAAAANRSPMLRDLETGVRTEVDAIQGAVVAAGEAVEIDAPADRVVAALIHARERRRTSNDAVPRRELEA